MWTLISEGSDSLTPVNLAIRTKVEPQKRKFLYIKPDVLGGSIYLYTFR
jgi:hypothetical protein